MMDPAYFVGRKPILDWLNATFGMHLTKVEETANGASHFHTGNRHRFAPQFEWPVQRLLIVIELLCGDILHFRPCRRGGVPDPGLHLQRRHRKHEQGQVGRQGAYREFSAHWADLASTLASAVGLKTCQTGVVPDALLTASTPSHFLDLDTLLLQAAHDFVPNYKIVQQVFQAKGVDKHVGA